MFATTVSTNSSNTASAARALYAIVLLTVVVAWAPVSAAAYGLPFAVMILYGISTRRARALTRAGALVGALIFAGLGWMLVYGDFYWRGAVLNVICYSGLIFFFVSPPFSVDPRSKVYAAIGRTLAVVGICESWLGILQATYGALAGNGFDLNNGDWVKGTIGLTMAGFSKGGNFGNPMFAYNVLFCAMGAWALCRNTTLRRMCVASVAVAFLLASVMHLIIIAIVAILISNLAMAKISRRLIKRFAWVAILAAFAVGATVLVLPDNLYSGQNIVLSTISGTTPKAIIVERALTSIPSKYPLQPLIGLGLGQFSSIGGLIATGQYFGSPVRPDRIAFLPQHLTAAQEGFFYDQWYRWAANAKELGSSQVPYVFWLSMYLELGAVSVAMLLVVLAKRILRTRRRFLVGQMSDRVALVVAFGVAFGVLANAQIDYFGVPQASFLSLLVIKICESKVWPSRAVRVLSGPDTDC